VSCSTSDIGKRERGGRRDRGVAEGTSAGFRVREAIKGADA